MVYSQASQLPGAAHTFPALALPDQVLLADPRDFDALYAINPHMVDGSGALKRIDRTLARNQWDAWRAALESSALRVTVAPPLDGFPDLVFCANQALPIAAGVCADGVARVVPSRMAHQERRGEVSHIVAQLERLGHRVAPLEGTATRLEGMGDGLWVHGRRLLLGGVGPRTAREAWDELSERYDVPIATLTLSDPDFYHLDTALAVLDDRSCLWFPRALDAAAQRMVEALFPQLIVADEEEARTKLACNAFSDGRGHVYVEATAAHTIAALQRSGYSVTTLHSSEFLKSGGSLFCMKLLFGPVVV
ncbi:MAG: amidinotransferase [Acidobacteriota bacterium]